MSDFKVGDLVRCVRPLHDLTAGKIYTVEELSGPYIRVVDDAGELGGWYPSRFEKVQPEAPKDAALEYLKAIVTNHGSRGGQPITLNVNIVKMLREVYGLELRPTYEFVPVNGE